MIAAAAAVPGRVPSVLPDGRATATMMFVVYAGVIYNALLAIVNANVAAQNFAAVAVVEMAILGLAAVRVFTLPFRPADAYPMALLYAGLLFAAYTSLVNERILIECVRNYLIICVFMMIGIRSSDSQIRVLFRILSIVILTFLLIEIFNTVLYVQIFKPAIYYANTRGIPLFSLDNSGLFRGALGFKGRFSFGLSTHRTSSIFLEQVSLANYAGILCIFLIARFPALPRSDRILHIVLLVLILLSNDSRTSSSFAMVCVLGYVLFPRFAAGLSLTIMPIVLVAGALMVATLGYSTSDDLRGRISLTIDHLSSFDTATFLGLDADAIAAQLDSGYCYLIASTSVVGLLAFWLFCAFVIPERTAEQRRCLLALNMYLFMNLMIGGTAVFSVKVAGPLWVLIGFMRTFAGPAPQAGPDRVPAATATLARASA